MMRLGTELLHDIDRASRLEWLETDGLGGWASSSVIGMNTRSYHGLLVASRPGEAGRTVMLARLDETLRLDEGGGAEHALGCNRFPGTVAPQGWRHLESFERGIVPVFTYRLGSTRLRKSVAAIHAGSTVVVYELDGERAASMELLPLLAARDSHALRRESPGALAVASFENGSLRLAVAGCVTPLMLLAPGAGFEPLPSWWRGFLYERELERGLAGREDLWTPGRLRIRLEPGRPWAIVITAQDRPAPDGLTRIAAERRRRTRLILTGPQPLPTAPPLARKLLELVPAADQFLIRREARSTVIAGYPWFAEWGRDTMIALPGLCLVTGRLEEGRRILEGFREQVRDGLLPNRFPDRVGDLPATNTVDAGLWFFVAGWRYLQAGGDEAWVLDTLLPTLRQIVACHDLGTHHGIGVDEDGLLSAGEEGVQLTWMDAKVGDWVVTPRIGRPVEINALWFNALRILADLEARAGHPRRAEKWSGRAAALKIRFDAAFWNPTLGCLYDVVTATQADGAIRPNQLFALALPFSLLDDIKGAAVVDTVERTLLTPVGLRTLAPLDPAYRPRYRGGVIERDGAYHQGTVWPWLLGPWYTALVRVRGEVGRDQARAHLAAFLHRHSQDGCIGSISEVFDGDEPHEPGGCIAQAWSVAELLRAASDDLGLIRVGTGC